MPYRFPITAASAVALGTVKTGLEGAASSMTQVRFVLFSQRDLAAYADQLARLG